MKAYRSACAVLLAAGFSCCILFPPTMLGQMADTGNSSAATIFITAQGRGSHAVPPVPQSDVTVLVKRQPVQITSWQPIRDANALTQLVFLFDESARSYLALQIPSMQKFIESLPPSFQVGTAYMSNGRAVFQQKLTSDHALAAKGMRLTNGIPGITGSPYFCLSSLAKHWPSQEKARRVVFMVTNGEDPYYRSGDLQDPYVRTAISDSQKAGLLVYSIYFRNTGFNGGALGTLFGQSYLLRVADETGGVAYNQTTISPVSFDPYLAQFKQSLENQYLLSFTAPGSGLQPITVKSKVSGVKLRAPAQVNLGSQT